MSQEITNKIYKVKKLVNNKVQTIYVFHGIKENDNMDNIFNSKEHDEIKENGTNVIISNQTIHPDDSIATIKIKILNELLKKHKDTNVSLEEIYLFCKKIEKLNSVAIYETLTQNKKISLTRLRLEQFIKNIDSDINGKHVPELEDKDIYSYDDIFKMELDNREFIMNKVLGQKFLIVENEYPFVFNPYDVTEYDRFLEQNARKSLSTLNNNLLLNTGDIYENSIYLCLAEDVLAHADEKNISEQTTLKVYYPFLYSKSINSLDNLNKERENLIEGNKKLLNEKVFDNFKTIDMFYNVYDMKKSNLNYISQGVKYVKVVMKPDFSVKIPLEIIFKILHATQDNPLIKYNPSLRQENVYRLYADKTSIDGRKIPYLKKATIFRLIKKLGHAKSVSVYIETNDNNVLTCEFDEEGYITMTGEFNNVIDVSEINDIFKKAINPIIQEIKSILEQSGYKLNLFNSLTDENVEIEEMTYETQIGIKKAFDLSLYKSCVYSVFVNETKPSSTKRGTYNLRFKRVSNFSKFSSQEAFIIEMMKQGLSGAEEYIKALLENFPEDLDETQARELVANMANQLQVERGVRKSDIKIKENPGFKTTIQVDFENSVLKITTENINNINYLHTLPIYLDTIVRLTQDKKSTNYPDTEIDNLCGKEEAIDVSYHDTTASTENYESSSVIEGDESVSYSNKKNSLYDLILGDDDDDENDTTGGNKDKLKYGNATVPTGMSSSEESIESNDYNPKENSSEESFPDIDQSKFDSSSSDEKSLPKLETSSSVEKSVESLPKLETSSSVEKSVESLPKLETPSSEEKSVESLPKLETPSSEEKSVESLPKLETPSSEEKSVETLPKLETPSSEEKSVETLPKLETPSSKEKSVETLPKLETPSSDILIQNVNMSSSEKSSSEKEESDEEESDEEENDGQVRNIDGMKLNKPYYFQSRLEKKDPVLIIKEDGPNYNGYARTCSSDKRRQPVVLTDEELEKIKKDNPGFLREEDVIKYGSDEKHQFNYICPRFWCLKSNTFINPSEIVNVNGELVHKPKKGPSCGKVLPKKEKKVKPGYYIYEFNDEKLYPGLIPGKHPDGFCLPCCFKNYNTDGRIRAKESCLDKSKKDTNKEDNVKEKDESYILGPEKFPLSQGRWGYLPPEIQTMLHEINADCQISKNNSKIKDNHPCLIRHGIEGNKRQSFVGAISDVLFFAKKIVNTKNEMTNDVAKVLSIKEMKKRIINNAINIDTFIKYQNGNLVVDFHDINKKVDIEKYNNSKLYKKLNMDKPEEKAYFTKVVSAFENFNLFLDDDEALIDHTYLWDIVSMPNKYLFPQGVNLVILQLPHDDITNNVQILCPTNHYSNEFYQSIKPTIFLLKEDDYYEPIYSYLSKEGKLFITKEFKEKDPHLSDTMRAIFNDLIKPFFELVCRPLESMPYAYKSVRPLLLLDLIKKLDEYDYKIEKLVMNFNNKIIGVVAQEPIGLKLSGFVPCYPSALNENIKKDLDFVFMNDASIWHNYNDTVLFLNKLDRRSKKRREKANIPCKPEFKIIEDELVVGILTNTNQFIQLSEPVNPADIPPDLNIEKNITDSDYIVNTKDKNMVQSEVQISTQQGVDDEREEYIKRIKLETSFYNVFRNTIRIALNDYANINIRQKIENELFKEYILYSDKLENINKLLRELIGKKIQFNGDKNYYKLIQEVSTCLVKDKKSCSDTPNLCVVTENGKCNLILPERNLITDKENEPIYFGRMSDELIRYNRIKSFMLQPQVYLSFGNIGYNLRENELIVIQSVLTQEYFDGLIPAITNKYIKYNSYDETEPIITQVYDNNNIPSLDHALGRKNENICDKVVKTHIVSSIWKKCFPENYKEIEYSRYNFCSFNFVIDIIEKMTNKRYKINDIKNYLHEEYKKYLDKFHDNIIDILIIEGKKTLGDQVKSGSLSFINFIYTDSYFLTTLDVWLLMDKFKIPTIFLSQKFILQTNYTKHIFTGYGDKKDHFIFIVLPGFRNQIVPNFKIITTDKGEFFIPLSKLNDDCVDEIEKSIHESITIEKYLEEFKMPSKTNYKKKKPIIYESDSNEVIVRQKKNPVVNNKIITKKTSPVPTEIPVEDKPVGKTKSKKIIIRGEPKNKTRRKLDEKKYKLIIDDSSS